MNPRKIREEIEFLLNYIAMYPNKHAEEFNNDFLMSTQDVPITDFIVMAMKELECIENITILGYDIITDQDEIDINRHMVNINYKKKDPMNIEIPKLKYVTDSRYGEINFKIRVTTNLNDRTIEKRILFPLEYEGTYLNGGKKMKAIWQLVDASVYNQRGCITLKSRMPIIIYKNTNRELIDVDNKSFMVPSYSYALNSTKKRLGNSQLSHTAKARVKFINPLMLYCAKMGYEVSKDYFGMKNIVDVVTDYKEKEKDDYYFFPLDDMFIRVDKYLFDKYPFVQSFVAMTYALRSRDFKVEKEDLEDKNYWINRIGYIGSAKNKNLASFHEKGMTTIYMVERLLDSVTINNLRLPNNYKRNIYDVIYWMISNFDELKARNNIDMNNKRIRKNEYIVQSSLGKKINENINKLIELKSRSKMNTIETLMELFNFNSDIILSGMRALNDLIKSDDLSNDLTFLSDLAYSTKGPNSLGENSSKKISSKYRQRHPSMVGIIDLNTTSNSDPGMSGSFTPFVQLYDKFYFTPIHEPCEERYNFDRSLVENEHKKLDVDVSSFNSYIKDLEEKKNFDQYFKPEQIKIVEKETIE
jgi:hypothetical protein